MSWKYSVAFFAVPRPLSVSIFSSLAFRCQSRSSTSQVVYKISRNRLRDSSILIISSAVPRACCPVSSKLAESNRADSVFWFRVKASVWRRKLASSKITRPLAFSCSARLSMISSSAQIFWPALMSSTCPSNLTKSLLFLLIRSAWISEADWLGSWLSTNLKLGTRQRPQFSSARTLPNDRLKKRLAINKFRCSSKLIELWKMKRFWHIKPRTASSDSESNNSRAGMNLAWTCQA